MLLDCVKGQFREKSLHEEMNGMEMILHGKRLQHLFQSHVILVNKLTVLTTQDRTCFTVQKNLKLILITNHSNFGDKYFDIFDQKCDARAEDVGTQPDETRQDQTIPKLTTKLLILVKGVTLSCAHC